jgi:hypothetical protein
MDGHSVEELGFQLLDRRDMTLYREVQYEVLCTLVEQGFLCHQQSSRL